MRAQRAKAKESGNGAQPVTQGKSPLTQPLSTYEDCGDLTFSEASEIRARNDLIEKIQTDIEDARKLLDERTRILTLLRNERLLQSHQMLRGRGLSIDDDYLLDHEGGKLWRTARAIAPAQDLQVIASGSEES